MARRRGSRQRSRFRIPRISGRGLRRGAGRAGSFGKDVLIGIGAADVADDITGATGFERYSFLARLAAGYLAGGAIGLGGVLVKDLLIGQKVPILGGGGQARVEAI